MSYLTRHQTAAGPRWALDGHYLPADFTLTDLLRHSRAAIVEQLAAAKTSGKADDPILPPLEHEHEVWASGVTYLRSRDARQAESSVGDVYSKVYEAERPELFLKSSGRRAVGPEATVCIRHDSTWDVPEPEIVLVLNADMEIVGYTAGNDMSSRSIEGENPLYLPQAKIYDNSCALGPGIVVATADEMAELPVSLAIHRDGEQVFSGKTGAAQMKRRFPELARYLGLALEFPVGALLMTGTGIVPPESFTLRGGDRVEVKIGELLLANPVQVTEDRS